jgi:hypothetical protein
MVSEAIQRLKDYLKTGPTEVDLKSWMSRLPPEEYVQCALYLVRTGPTTFVGVYSLEHAYKQPDRLSDNDLFLELDKALDDSAIVVDGKIAPVNPMDNPEPASRFASLYNEAVRRGFNRDDIGFGMRPSRKTIRSLSEGDDPDWKRFEKLVARIHIALCRGAEVKWSEKMLDASGTERQIDVTIRTKSGPHEILGIVQCKFEKRPVTITEVEAFISVKRDLNAGIAIMVSQRGYQSGAEAKGKLHDIRLWTLEEAESAAWREEMRLVRLRYPMFSEVKFLPSISTGAWQQQDMGIDFGSVDICRGGHKTTLFDVLAQMIQDSAERCLRVPFWMDVAFPDATVTLLGRTFPLEKVEIHFTREVDIEEQKQVKVPLGSSYSFKRNNGEEILLTERDLPPLNPLTRG